MLALFPLAILLLTPHCVAADPSTEGVSSREAKANAIRGIPFQRLTSKASKDIRSVVERPSFFRRMPTQQIDCDARMFTFLVRRPEVMVNIWEIMGITSVSARRVSPFSFFANDGVGMKCKCDMVYGDANLHIYYGRGDYDGSMTPRKIKGRCVCILRSQTSTGPDGIPMVHSTMDVFLKLDNLGADILARTLGPFVGKTADQNFVETAKFMGQISRICKRSPAAAQGLALKLENIDAGVQREFASIAASIAQTDGGGAVQPTVGREYLSTSRSRYVGHSNIPTAERSPPSRSESYNLPDGYASQPQSSRLTNQSMRPSAIVPHKPNVYMRR